MLAVGIALAAAPPAFAGPAYMGGSLPEAAVTGSAYTPTVGVTLQPLAGNRVRVAFDTTLRCGRTVTQIRRTRTASWDGRTLSAHGTAKRPRFKWTLSASADGRTATGTLRITARRNGKACAGRAKRGFVAHFDKAPVGTPSRPAAGAVYYGGGPRLERGRRPGSTVLRVSPDGSRVAARWSVLARCGHGRTVPLINLTPPTRIGPAGGFLRRERFRAGAVRYRVAFRGRFTGQTASGSLRMRATVRRAGRVIARCDTRTRGWSASAAGEPPGPVPTAPPPATPTPPPSPDPTFRPDPVVGSWSFDMSGDPGEYITQGETWHHGSAFNEPINVDVFTPGDQIQFMIQTRDGEGWDGSFATLDDSPLHTGTYQSGNGASMSFAGHGRGCGRFTGPFTISALSYDANGALRTLKVTFEAYCEGLEKAMRGSFNFQAR